LPPLPINASLETPAATGSSLRFPSKFDVESGQWMLFTRYTYSRPDKNSPPVENKAGNTVSLPIPTQLMAAYGAQWENVELGMFGKNISAGVAGAVNEIKTKAGTLADQLASGQTTATTKMNIMMKTFTDSFSSFSIEALKGAGIDYAADLATASETFTKAGSYHGLARNPFNAVLYSGPTFRTFEFEWKLIPKNRAEATVIKNIIREFKIAMHPSFLKGFEDNLFEYPDIYKINMSNSAHTFKIAHCALKDFSVSYGTEGATPKYFEGDIPFSVTMRCQFQELTILTREDILTAGDGGY